MEQGLFLFWHFKALHLVDDTTEQGVFLYLIAISSEPSDESGLLTNRSHIWKWHLNEMVMIGQLGLFLLLSLIHLLIRKHNRPSPINFLERDDL